MKVRQCILTKNNCYIKGVKISKVTGIVVHSTGANNKNLKRYVQPLKTYADYDHIISDLGKNNYGNHWNRGGLLKKCVHAFIGVNAKGEVETYQTLPWDFCCWGCGSDKKGSYNYNPTARIQFEICEDNLKDEKYFNAVMKEAQEFCAWLCKKYNLSVDKICSHAEAHAAGYGDNHSDIDHWLVKFGKSMDWFRAEVQKLLSKDKPAPVADKPSVKEWQKAAIADGYSFPKYGADGAWGSECESVAKQALVQKQSTYTNKNLTKVVQKVVGVTADGLCGAKTDAAIKAYQKANGLTADGIVGLNTWKKILGIK